MNTKQKFAREFEQMTEDAELNALQKVSLERPLSDSEFKRFTKLAHKRIGG